MALALAAVLLLSLAPATLSAQTLTKRPKLLVPSQPEYPQAAWDDDIEGKVVLLLTLDTAGKVLAVELVSGPGEGLDEAAMAAAKKLVFSPAELDGVPVAIKIRYTYKFVKDEKALEALPPAQPCVETDTRPKGILKGTVLRRGYGIPVKGAEVYLLDMDQAVITDENGMFEVEVAPGGYAITINVPGYWPFETLEKIEPGQTKEVELFLDRKKHAKYHTVVWGSDDKTVVGSTTLFSSEINEIPGTLGDPYRVVMLLPGVVSSMSGLGYPIVRGSLPGDTLYTVDGIQVPMLYHLIFGTSVINPRFAEGLNFKPGGWGYENGGFIGGMVETMTADAEDERITAADLSVVQMSAFHSQKWGGTGLTMGARYGTLGLIIEGLASDVVFRMWDYQFKLSQELGKDDELKLMVFGAGNVVGSNDPYLNQESVFSLGFHRVDLKYTHTLKGGWLSAGVELGYESFVPPDETSDVIDGIDDTPYVDPGYESPYGAPGDYTGTNGEMPQDDTWSSTYFYAKPYIRTSFLVLDGLQMKAGASLSYQDFGMVMGDTLFDVPDTGLTLEAYAGLELSFGKVTVTPGFRVDSYHWSDDTSLVASSFDPRVGVAYDVLPWLSLKAAAGIYHGPPRVTLVEPPFVFGPVPGMVGAGLDRGLNESTQLTMGAEIQLPYKFEIQVQGFYNDISSSVDFSVMEAELTPVEGNPCDGISIDYYTGDILDDPFENVTEEYLSTTGHSYGLEIMIRRRLAENVFGWISYTWSKSERNVPYWGKVPFDFDQTHVINAVVSWEVGRHWTIGMTFHYNTGRPYTPEIAYACSGGDLWATWETYAYKQGPYNSKRLPDFWRLDLRIQKREIFETWYFDFYVDIINVTFNWEVIGYHYEDAKLVEDSFPVFLPMIGIRGQF